MELARSILDSKDLTVVAAPHMKALWAASGENTHLAVLAGDHVVYVSTLNGMTLLSANAAIGQSGPLHCTATGKALIASLPRGVTEGLIVSLGFEAFTPRTLTSAEALHKELAQIRVTGYAVDDREYHPGVRCVAAPVFGIGGVIASLGVSAPADRLDADRLRVLAPIVVDTAGRVSRELGGTASRAASSASCAPGARSSRTTSRPTACPTWWASLATGACPWSMPSSVATARRSSRCDTSSPRRTSRTPTSGWRASRSRS